MDVGIFYGVDLKPMQGLIFECHTPSRIAIELLEPDDGPKRGDDVR